VYLNTQDRTIYFSNGYGEDGRKYKMNYDPGLSLGNIRFCVGLCKKKDIVSIVSLGDVMS
jgi:hypothetical protein